MAEPLDSSVTDVLLVGGGMASASAAAELRRLGFTGSVLLVTREDGAPYHRPPITKALLGGSGDHQHTAIHPDDWWDHQDVALLTRAAVVALDPAAHIATLADRRVVRYGRALLATGATVRRLNVDGAGLDGIHYLRTPANAYRLRAEVVTARSVVLVGGSFVAVETAASLAARGVPCTMVMQEESPLQRAFGPTVARFVAELLESHGVGLVGGADVVGFTGQTRVTGVRTADGRWIAADLVVVGAGAVPDTRLAARAGLAIGATGGLRTDSRLRTAAADLYAAGDVCEYDSVVHGRPLRVEHERHAAAQGVTAAANMLGADTPHRVVPYFWTDIADWARLEYVGPARCWDQQVVTGSVSGGDFTVWYLNAGRLVAALTSGRPYDLDTAREVIGSPDQAVGSAVLRRAFSGAAG